MIYLPVAQKNRVTLTNNIADGINLPNVKSTIQ